MSDVQAIRHLGRNIIECEDFDDPEGFLDEVTHTLERLRTRIAELEAERDDLRYDIDEAKGFAKACQRHRMAQIGSSGSVLDEDLGHLYEALSRSDTEAA